MIDILSVQSFYLDNHVNPNRSANTFSTERTASHWRKAPSVTFTCVVDPYGAPDIFASRFKGLLDGHLARKGNKSHLDHHSTTPQDEMDIMDFSSLLWTHWYNPVRLEYCLKFVYGCLTVTVWLDVFADLLQAFHHLCLEGGQWLKVQLKQRPVWGQVSRKLTLMLPLACVCSNGLWHLVFWKTFVYTITGWKRAVAYPFSFLPLRCSYVIFCVLVSILQFVVIMRAPSILFSYSPFTMHIVQSTFFIFSQLEPLSFIINLSSSQLMISQK